MQKSEESKLALLLELCPYYHQSYSPSLSRRVLWYAELHLKAQIRGQKNLLKPWTNPNSVSFYTVSNHMLTMQPQREK